MTRYLRTAIGTIATLGLAVAATAGLAHAAGMGGETGAEMGGMHGMDGMHGMHGMHQHGGAGQQLMTPAERQSLREKMRGASSPEERQGLAAANRAEMEKRAKDKGIALPGHAGHGGAMGAGRGPAAAGDQK